MTRNIIRGLLLLSMISLMSGCTDRGKLNPLGWERISPEADSLTLAIERTIMMNPQTLPKYFFQS